MPLYEYWCGSCEQRFERLERGSSPPAAPRPGCPTCGAPATRVFSTFAPRGDRSVSSTQGVCRHKYGCSCARKD